MRAAFTPLRNLFASEVQQELDRHPVVEIGTIREKDIAHLPDPVKRYLGYCGYINKMDVLNARVIWQDVYLKPDRNKAWMKMECFQFNSVAEPTRIAYMRSHLFGLIPFEGRDKCQEGKGSMIIRLMKYITLANAKGKEMDASALVTVLAESLLIPGYILKNYISWTPIDAGSCQARLQFQGTDVKGIFYFNESGEATRFVTDDRYYAAKGRQFKKSPWTVTFEAYRAKGGIKFPGRISASWTMEEGNEPYFRGDIAMLEVNVLQP